MLQRLAENGYPVDFEAFDALFNLTITPTTSVDVDAEPVIKFSQVVKKAIRKSGFACDLTDIVVFVLVLNPDIGVTKDATTWKRASRSYVVRRNIDFIGWQHAKASDRKKMLTACVIDAIASIPVKHLSELSKESLGEIVLGAARSLKPVG